MLDSILGKRDFMKWTKRGEELESLYQIALQNVRTKKKAIIYGYSREGRSFADMLKCIGDVKILAYVDRRYNEFAEDRTGIPIISPECLDDYVDEDTFIYIAIQYYTVDDVIIALSNRGYTEWYDFLVIHKLRMLREMVENDFLMIPLIEIPITEKCTLNCKKCSFFTPYYKQPQNFKLEDVVLWLDEVFAKAGYIETLRFVGGEPFLYPSFYEVLCYVKEKYISKIGRIVILTNATIVPNEKTLELIGSYPRARIGITDYTHVVNYKEKLEMFKDKLHQYNIDYWCDADKTWFDLKFPEEKIPATNVRKVFDDCSHHCRTLCDHKLFWCSFNASAHRANLIDSKINSDYINIVDATKNEILEFIWGYSELGYNDLCRWCKRAEYISIDSGEQVTRKDI